MRRWRTPAVLAALGTAAAPAANAQVVLDGRIDPTEIGAAAAGKYVLLGTFSPAHTANTGFGNWGLMRLYAANSGTKVYLAVVGTPENNGNTLQLYLDLPNLTNGVPAGIPLPGTNGSSTSFSGAQPRMDMDTDLGVALQATGSSYGPQGVVYNGSGTPGSSLAFSAGVPVSGAPVTMSAAQTTGVYSRFAAMRMAFLNTSSGDITTNPGNYGWEVELDRAALGNPANGSLMRVMAAYVNVDGGYFSSDVIPEIPGNGNNNLANNPDFTTYPGIQAANYTISAPTSSTQALNYNSGGAQVLSTPYFDLGTSGSVIATANHDDANSAAQNIGFNFQYDGLSFSQFVLNTNGFIKLGATTPSTAGLYFSGPQTNAGGPFNSTSAADADLLVPFNHNLVDGTVSAEYRVATTGTAPNRVCTIQWKNVSDILVDATTGKQYNTAQFQAKLYETTNVIDFVYGPATAGPGPDGFKAGAVGLKGMGTNADQLLTVTKTSGLAWSAATIQGGNYTSSAFNFRSTVLPVSGVTYRFRPSVAADAGVQVLYSLGKLPVPFGTPHVAQAVVYNYGTNTLTNVPVTLAVTGTTSFSNTKTIASLAPGTAATVTFDAYTPTTQGTNTLTVTLAADDNLANNTTTFQQTVTSNTFAYAEPGTAPYTSAGFGTSSGIIAAKFTTNTVRTVRAVNVYLDGTATVGNTVYGTVLDNQGNLLGRTPDYVVQAADLGTLKTFAFATPVTVGAGDFLVGLAQTAATVAYFPVGFQAETPTRTNTFFSTGITGGPLTDVAVSNSTLGRPVIEAVVNVVSLATSVTVVCSSPNTGTLTLFDFAGTVSRYQANTGAGYVDLAGTSASYTFSNLTVSTTFRAVTTTSTNQTIFSSPVTISVLPRPTATLTASSPVTFCGSGTLTLNAAQTAGATYQFLLNGAPISGTAGSTYSATVSSSGSYAVLVTNATGCASTSSPLAVTVNPATSAAFAYGAATYCQSGTPPTPTVTGTAGGAFSAGSGLSINPSTGALNLAASAPGTYSVAYAVGGPCPSSGSAVITITAAPVAAFGYAAASYCVSATGTAAAVLATGSTGGTFSASPAGLAIDAATGTITPSGSTAGTYTVTNTVAAANGCAATSASATVGINAAPVAGLTAGGATTFCQGGSVVLTASGGSSYQFLFNGQPINGTTASSYTATAAGSYAVVATNAAGCTASGTPIAVTVNPQTTATFSYASASYCVSGTNPTPSITGTAGGAFSAGSGLAINAATGVLTLASSTPGTYTVTYSVGGSCPSSGTATATINAAPTAGFSYAAPSYCVSAAATASPVVTGVSGTFSAPAGLSVDAATGVISPSTSTPGTYTVTNTVAAANGCATVTATAQVTIAPAPVVAVSASGSTTFCQGSSVVLTATGGNSYLWSNGATTAAITVTTAGSYTVTATSAAGCTATSSATTVTVNPATTATFAYASTTYCQSGSNPTPTPTVTGTAGGVFSSTTGLVINATTGAVNLATSAAGTYTVTYAVGGTCPSTGTATLTVTAAPLATFGYASSSYCAGAAASPAPTAATGAALGTFSSMAGLALNATTGAIALATSTAGTYTVTNTVAAANGCAAATASVTVTINAAPVRPTVSAQYNGPTTTLTSSSPTGNQWYLNGQPVNGATGQTYVVNSAAQLGSYTVVVTNASGCSSVPSQALVLTATAQPLAGTDLHLFPNPTTDGQLTLQLSGYRAAVRLSVLDATGRVVYRQALAPSASSQQTLPLNLAHLPTGLYVLRVQTEGGTATRRIVRE